MTTPGLDAEGFGEEPLHFYGEWLDAEPGSGGRSDLAPAGDEVIWHLLAMEPGVEVLDLAAGHGRIATRCSAHGSRGILWSSRRSVVVAAVAALGGEDGRDWRGLSRPRCAV